MADKNPDAPAIIEEDRIVRYSQPDKMIELKRITALPTLMHWRAEVIRNVSGVEPHPRMLVANRQYYRKHIADDTHLAFVAEYDGVECGCGAVCFTEELPSPNNPTGRCAYLMNIYVRELFRNKGIAHHIITRLVDEARGRGCGKIYLETTSDEGGKCKIVPNARYLFSGASIYRKYLHIAIVPVNQI